MASGTVAVEAFVAAINAKDIDSVMEFFTPDAVYHNMPMAPVSGLAAIRQVIERFIGPAEEVDWQILTLAESGDSVMAERMDRFVIDGKTVGLPCSGVFEMVDGKIKIWRDYFHMAAWLRQTGVGD
ncbi:MAG: nuclear transport factor 2 family protein [Proteobacteria bacterium]|nr:nuclear transport factor 2 family protein [Pseudomonadota bacterium]